jgi:transposase
LTCWRRLRDWEGQGIWLRAGRTLLAELNDRQQLKWSESFLDGSFVPAKKRGSGVGKTKRGKGTKWMAVADGSGVPLGVRLYAASRSDVRLAEETLVTIRVGRRHRGGRPRQKPARVIADQGYDSDALRERRRRRGTILISPHRSNWHRTPPQDGRVLRRYKRRWIVERSIAWLGNFRRLVMRCDRSRTIYQAFIHIACLVIVLCGGS